MRRERVWLLLLIGRSRQQETLRHDAWSEFPLALGVPNRKTQLISHTVSL